jgi:signal transduction histidine kinase
MIQASRAPGLRPAVAMLFAVFMAMATNRLCAEPLLHEHFDQKVADNSAIGGALDWHAVALHAGIAVDFSYSTPGAEYPSLSHSPSHGGVHGLGYLVMGAGNVVSNILVWRETGTNFHGRPITEISFYTKNDFAASKERIVVRIGGQWYATDATFQDVGGNDVWTLNTFAFTRQPSAWRPLDTNRLTLGSPLTAPLPDGEVTAVGALGAGHGTGKVRLDEFQVLAGPQIDPAYLVGSWIWAQRTFDRQTCRFWKTIEIPSRAFVSKARLRLTADNSYRAFVDGIEFGRGSEWRRLTEYDLTLFLTPGIHVLAIEAFNEWGAAGLVGGVTVELGDGRVIETPSDATWRIVPHEQKGWTTRKSPRDDWPAARVISRFRDWPGLPERPQVLFPSALQPVMAKFWQTGWFQITMLSFCVVVAVICLRLLGQLALQSRAQQVLQRERARIARDIHDDFGAGLTQLVLLGETAQNGAPAGSPTRHEFARVSETGRRLLSSIDEVVWMVNSQRDSLRDFETYVCRYAENFLRASSVRYRLDCDLEIPEAAFDLGTRRSFFLAIKEALNNAIRHSGATEVSLAINVIADKVKVVVKDNGKGFDPKSRDLSRNGLSNMAQRMAEVSGSCQVTSQSGCGCEVELIAPLKHRSRLWRQQKIKSASKPSETIQPSS